MKTCSRGPRMKSRPDTRQRAYMNRDLMRNLILMLVLSCASALSGLAQQQPQLPPVEPPQQMPGSNNTPTLRVTTHEVLVPTLVEKPHGEGIVYGLKQSDFVVADNGVPQKIHVEGE